MCVSIWYTTAYDESVCVCLCTTNLLKHRRRNGHEVCVYSLVYVTILFLSIPTYVMIEILISRESLSKMTATLLYKENYKYIGSPRRNAESWYYKCSFTAPKGGQ